MIFLSVANQSVLHTLGHMPSGMPLHRISAHGGGKHGTYSKSNLMRTKLVEQFKGPDATTWIRLTKAGREFVEAVK